ncbi:MAG: cupin domain-containing protein [bacterium]|nr:cupin domain-containing protein [bacterium]MXX64493.1 cupin domain-containing protein [Acidimicrobiia bacterium]MCY3579097.1 cupin domain-containing protein [bacterium]MCY3653203.1 cupin domain-containing protein [bacterium]MDE0642770.1 cupin domain-containing protein [bacterium]
MNKRRFADVEAYQHADDGYYYRPLVAGKELFSYVAHVPAGGYMPPDAEEAELFELSLFMLEGELEGILNEDRIKLEPGDALHIPRGTPFGVENTGSATVSFVLSFAPPPPNLDLSTMKQSALKRGRTVIEAPDVENVVGPITFP